MTAGPYLLRPTWEDSDDRVPAAHAADTGGTVRVDRADHDDALADGDGNGYVDHRLVGRRLRSYSAASEKKSIDTAVEIGLEPEQAVALAAAAADQTQLRKALRAAKWQRFGTDEFCYVEVDILTYRIAESLENVRFEDRRGHGTLRMPRYRSVPDAALLTITVGDSATLIDTMAPLIAWVEENNPHVPSIAERGIETPGWLTFARIATSDQGTVTVLDSTDAFGRAVGAHRGLGIKFQDVLWNLRPGSRRAGNLHRDLMRWADREDLTLEQATKVRCAIMPNAKVIIAYRGPRPFEKARRRLVAHLHMAPPLGFTVETTINAKANASTDGLYDEGLLLPVDGLSSEQVREALEGADDHGLRPDEVAVLACGTLNPRRYARATRVIGDALADLTGSRPDVNERTLMAAEVALRGLPIEPTLQPRRSALERSWRWAQLRSVALTRSGPLELLGDAIKELHDGSDGAAGPATAELATLASYHLVAGKAQLLTRSEHGGSSGGTESLAILRKLAGHDDGLRQLAQVVLDGRSGRTPQLLTAGTLPKDGPIVGSEPLTREALLELIADEEEQVEHTTAEDRFAEAVRQFQDKADDLLEAARAVAEVRDETDLPLVETRGYSSNEAKTAIEDTLALYEEWAAVRRVAQRTAQNAVS